MRLSAERYAKLPELGRAIVDAERAIAPILAQRVLTLDEARRGSALIRERDRLVRSADAIYGHAGTGRGDGGAARS